MKVKFFVGAVESGYNIATNIEVHYLKRLDSVIEANNSAAAQAYDRLLRDTHKEFIRSDTHYPTFVALDIFLSEVKKS